MSLIAHAERELQFLKTGEAMNEAMHAHLTKMVQVFSDEHHSGFSARYASATLQRLLNFEPVRPLTGEADEWTEVSDGLFQNKRCPHVFRENGEAYTINGIVRKWPDGSGSQRGDRTPITFPYTPVEPITVTVDQDGVPLPTLQQKADFLKDALVSVLKLVRDYLPPGGIDAADLVAKTIGIVDPWPVPGDDPDQQGVK